MEEADGKSRWKTAGRHRYRDLIHNIFRIVPRERSPNFRQSDGITIRQPFSSTPSLHQNTMSSSAIGIHPGTLDLRGSRSRHWIDGQADALTGLAPAPLPAVDTSAPALSIAPSPASDLAALPADAAAQPTPSPEAAGSLAAPLQLSRDLQPWSQDRVNDLIAAGTVKASWLPDIQAVVPEKLLIQREHQRDLLRFSNSIANTGLNNWQVRRGVQLTEETNPALMAYARSLGLDTSELAVTAQELLHEDGSIAAVIPDAALSEYHPEHKHFHIGETAEFSIERLDATGGWDPVTGLDAVKTTFCLIDVNQIQPAGGADADEYEIIKSPANANVYNDCFADVQGIQDGWIDRYSHSLQGQEVDITSLAAGTYRLVVQVNPSQWFLESDYSNNLSTIGFDLHRNKRGQATLTERPEWTTGIWFDQSPNGMG